MKQLSYSFLLEAKQPIAHHEGTLGNMSIFMRHKVRQPDGSFAQVPYLTGDTCRHGLRESSSYAYLAATGIEGRLTEGALRLLFNGGMLTGRGDAASVSLGEYRDLCDLFPPLAIFGGCVSNRSVPGRLQVDAAELVCEETLHFLPREVTAWLAAKGIGIASCRAYVEEEQRVRMDSSLDPGKRLLLSAEERARVEGRLLQGEAASAADDAVQRESAKSTMLPRSAEVLCTGSLFFWRVQATTYSDLDEDTFHVAVAAWLSRCRVGGKQATGHGRLEAVAGFEGQSVTLAERLESFSLAEREPRIGRIFRAHVESKKEAIAAWLPTVNA